MTEASDGIANVVAGLGTERDKASYSRYTFNRVLTQSELEIMYQVSWLAKRIINAVADDMTREWRTITFDSTDDTHQQAVEKEEKRLKVRDKVNTALRWARLYGGAALIVGIKGDKDLKQPLDVTRVQKGGLEWIQPVDRWRLSGTGRIVTDLGSDSFGFPESYMLSSTMGQNGIEIHHSRVLRFHGQKLPYNLFLKNGYWDDSELQHVLNSITNADTASASIATMLFEANVDVITSQNITDLLGTKDGETKLIKRFQAAALLKSMNRMLLLDGDETYEKKSNQFANLDKIWLQFMVDVCGAADIPMTRLFGQSAGGLNANGDNDIRNYYDMAKAKQNSELREPLEYLDQMLVRSALGVMPDDYEFTFNSLWQMSDADKATMQKTKADRDKIYLDAGVVTEGVVARELQEDGTYKNLTDEDVDLAEELSQAAREHEDLTSQANLQITQNQANIDPSKSQPSTEVV